MSTVPTLACRNPTGDNENWNVNLGFVFQTFTKKPHANLKVKQYSGCKGFLSTLCFTPKFLRTPFDLTASDNCSTAIIVFLSHKQDASQWMQKINILSLQDCFQTVMKQLIPKPQYQLLSYEYVFTPVHLFPTSLLPAVNHIFPANSLCVSFLST